MPPGTYFGLQATVNVAGSGPIQVTAGDDVIIGTAGPDVLTANGDSAADDLSGGTGSDRCTVDAVDQATSCETVG
jgi:Ca2+-binding RTX toxin-like protein